MKVLLTLSLLLAAATGLRAAPVSILYDASLADPDPLTQSWQSNEVTSPGSDGNGDGRIDSPANVGPITDAEGSAWQIHDQLSSFSVDRPEYVVPLGQDALRKMYFDGWVFEFEVRLSNASPGYAGFCGWGLAPADDPGWGLGSVESRIGFVLRYGDNGEFLIEPSGYAQVDLGPGSAADFHTIRVVGEAQSSLAEWFLDGVSQGTLDLSTIEVPGSYRGVMMSAGSSASRVGATDWKRVTLESTDRGFGGEIPVAGDDLSTLSARFEVDGGGTIAVNIGEGASPLISYVPSISNSGDYGVNVGLVDHFRDGVMLASTTGSATSASVASTADYYFIAVHDSSGGEADADVSIGWFGYDGWLGGRTTNASNGAPLTLAASHPEIRQGAEFTDDGGGLCTVDLRELNAPSDTGVLLVSHAKNEANFALSQANTDGTFTLFVHDNTTDAGTYERDPVSFVYLPLADVGKKGLVALGRIVANGATEIGAGSYTLSPQGTGTWHLAIPGHDPTTGVLMISAEGGETHNLDNLVSARWDSDHWVIESRDLPGGGLQTPGAADEPVFSFAFLTNAGSGRRIVIDSSAGTLSVDENGSGPVDQGGSLDGVPYRAVKEAGILRVVFDGDLHLGDGDYLVGTGERAIEIITSGDIAIAEGALVNASADLQPGPGGGSGGASAAGGAGGDGGAPGYAGGNPSAQPQPGENGDKGTAGKDGGAAFNNPLGGGSGRTDLGRPNGGTGRPAFGLGVQAPPGGPGSSGWQAYGGEVVRDTDLLTAGAGGGTGAGGGGGGGGGGGAGFVSVQPNYNTPDPYDFITVYSQGPTGADGGRGGNGGIGGHGGGAIRFTAYGTLDVAATFFALGTDGKPGSTGSPGLTDPVGPSGGPGGTGGAGGGGAGGTVSFRGSVATRLAPQIRVDGGESGGNDPLGNGDTGRAVIALGAADFEGSATEGSLETAPGLRGPNPHLAGAGETPYLPMLKGGAELGGLLDARNAGHFPDLLAARPAEGWLALTRSDSFEGVSFPGYDWVFLVNGTRDSLADPVLGVGDSTYYHYLLDGGPATNPVFGGAGAGLHLTLPDSEVYATLVPDAETQLCFGFRPGGTLVLEMATLSNGQTAWLELPGPNHGTPPAPTSVTPPSAPLPAASSQFMNYGTSGSLTVNLTDPAGNPLPEALWSVLGDGRVIPSGTSLEGLEPGVYTVRFEAVPGWLPPQDHPVTIVPGSGVATTITRHYTPATIYQVGDITPQAVRGGGVLGFGVPVGTSVEVIDGTVDGTLFVGNDGFFSYSPSEEDRMPFVLRFDDGATTQDVIITPLHDLAGETEILALRPNGNSLPDPENRDYNSIHLGPGNRETNFNEAQFARIVTLSGKKVVIDDLADRDYFYQELYDDETIQELRIYAETVEIAAELRVPQTDVIIYARELRFTGPDAVINTTPIAAPSGTAGLPGGNVTLHVLRLSSDPSDDPRFILNGGTSPNQPGGDSGQLASPYEDLADFATIAGGSGSTDGAALPPLVHSDPAELPTGFRWMHPIALRAALAHAKDIYFLGFMTEAEEIFRDYDRLLGVLGDFDPLPPLIDSSDPALEFAELGNDVDRHLARIADKLDYFGNPAGWVPLLSFEATLLMTDSVIDDAMDTLYLSYWLNRTSETIKSDLDAARQAEVELREENARLRNRMPQLRGEIADLEDKQTDIESLITDIGGRLEAIENRLQQRAEERVEERRRKEAWKKRVRTAATIMQVVPVGQPALGAIGGGLDLVSRIDEQSTLDTVIGAASVVGNYQVASLSQQAADLEAETEPPSFDSATTDEQKRAAYLDQAANIQGVLGQLQSGSASLQSFLAGNEAPRGEIDAELERLKATDPQFQGVAARLVRLMDEKQRFLARLVAAQNELREIPGRIMKNQLATERLNHSATQLGGILDPQALSVVREMERRTKDRLRRQFYLLAKSYEYRMLEPYRQGGAAFDPVSVFVKVVRILDAAQNGGGTQEEMDATNSGTPHVLNPSGFGTLRSLFKSELQTLSDRIVGDYDLLTKVTAEFQDGTNVLELSDASLAEMNDTGMRQTIINLSREGVLGRFPVREMQRIADLELDRADFTLTLDGTPTTAAAAGLANGSSMVIDIIHSGLSRLTRDGNTYVFRHFQDREDGANPIRWKYEVDLLTGEITRIRRPETVESLLTALLGEDGALDIQRFSRPGADADLKIEVSTSIEGETTGAIGVQLDALTLNAVIDFFDSTGEPELRIDIRDPDGEPLDILPRFFFDAAGGGTIADINGRRDGLGRVLRSFNEDSLEITPQDFFGDPITEGDAMPAGFRFVHWLGQNGGVVGPTTGPYGDRTSGNRLIVANNDDKRFTAVYEYVGDADPAEVQGIALDISTSGGGITEYVVTFNEDVTGVNVEDFYATGGIIESVTGSGSVRRVRVSGTPVAFGLLDDDSILDGGGNSLAGAGEGNGDADYDGSTQTGSRPATLSLVGFEPGGTARLFVAGPEMETWQLQWSPDLEQWFPLENLTLTAAGEEVTDPDAAEDDRRFYRLSDVLLPLP